MKLKRPIIFLSSMLFFAILLINLLGLRNGIINVTKKTSEFGCECHGFIPSSQTHVKIDGPSMMAPGDTALFRLVITSDTVFSAGGTDIATYYGNLFVSDLDTGLRRARDTIISPDYELTHTWPKPIMGDSVEFIFTYIAPMMDGVYDTIYANGNAVDLDNDPFGDKWNYASNKVVYVSTTSVGNNNGIANSFKLDQNYPNPFNPSTNISFSILKASNLSLTVYDLSGKEVASLINNKYYSGGDYTVKFETSKYNLSSGVYFYKLSAGDVSEVKKMMLIK